MPTGHDVLQRDYLAMFLDERELDDWNIETPFSYRGFRGFVDLYTLKKYLARKDLHVYDFKCDIWDVGDTVRRLKVYAEYFHRTLNHQIDEVFLHLVVDIKNESLIKLIDEYNVLFKKVAPNVSVTVVDFDRSREDVYWLSLKRRSPPYEISLHEWFMQLREDLGYNSPTARPRCSSDAVDSIDSPDGGTDSSPRCTGVTLFEKLKNGK